MPVERSALARREAERARSLSAPSTWLAMSAASACMRSTFSSMVPSLAWKIRSLSAGALAARDDFLSWSQKNLASDRRARSTRSLPATTCLPLSAVSVLATTTKRLASLPSASRHEKYFWCERMEVISTSGGTSMKASSMEPM